MVMQHAELIRDWHPLDHTSPPEYVPPSWTGPHVGVRLVEGLRTLALLPTRRGPREYGNHWPDWIYEWEDLLAQQEIEQEEKDRANRKQNRTRLSPSSVEIARMEQVIAWPAHYLRSFPQLLRTVQLAALARARHRDLHWVARKLSVPGRLVRRWNREGVDKIALGLIRDRVPVF
jgi:hypothetical protein